MNRVRTHYFEIHITLDPITNNDQQLLLNNIMIPRGYRQADLVMLKPGEQPQAHTEDAFVSARTDNYPDAVMSVVDMVKKLIECGFRVRRYKIEDTIVDSRREDSFGLIGESA